MRKSNFFIMFLILALFMGVTGVYGAGRITVLVDGEPISTDQEAVIVNGRTLLPMRAIFEALGADVEWESESKTVMAFTDDVAVRFVVGEPSMTYGEIGGVAQTTGLDTAPAIINSRTMIPARAAAEALGCTVDWDADNYRVTITSPGGNRAEITTRPTTERITEATTRRITTTETTTEATTSTFDIDISYVSGYGGMNRRETPNGLVDGNTGTKWCSYLYDEGIYAIWESSRPVKVTGYTMVTGNDTGSYPGRNPTDWVLYGCNSSGEPDKDSNWQVIDERRGDSTLPSSNYSERYFTVSGDVPEYKYFMLTIEGVRSGNIFQLSELALNYEGSGVDTPSVGGGSTPAPTPGGNRDRIRQCDMCSNGRVSCPYCHGTGIGQTIYIMGMPTPQSCTYCGGAGWRVCDKCGGSGQIEE